MKIPNALFIRLCQASEEALDKITSQSVALRTFAKTRIPKDEIDLPVDMAEMFKSMIANHPDEEVRAYYLGELKRLFGGL